jgi:sterol-4alpha-carboxylate 3-dehydrogenase (decarboxylating)
VLKEGKCYVQIGDNTNLFDMTYVGNIAHAHLLAADKLAPPQPMDKNAAHEALSTPLPPIDITTGRRRIPTSAARPLGPYVERPPNADALLAAWNAPPPQRLPVTRTRFDQLCDAALTRAERSPLDVAGQAFYISNGEPLYFWDFMRAIWRAADPETYPAKSNWVLPKPVGFALASVLEFFGRVVGSEPALTRFRITFASAHRWHNIEKARRVLGYEPQVGLEEGLRRTMEVRSSSPFSRQFTSPDVVPVVEKRGAALGSGVHICYAGFLMVQDLYPCISYTQAPILMLYLRSQHVSVLFACRWTRAHVLVTPCCEQYVEFSH